MGHADQDKTAMQPLALKVELEIALRQHLLRPLGSLRLPITAVPKHDCSAAISTFGNRPFEVAIIERVIFDLDGEPFVMRVERRSFGHSPGFENAIQLKPQIIVQAVASCFWMTKRRRFDDLTES